jgi:hypothetical protein
VRKEAERGRMVEGIAKKRKKKRKKKEKRKKKLPCRRA